jgi:hypothetical protein
VGASFREVDEVSFQVLHQAADGIQLGVSLSAGFREGCRALDVVVAGVELDCVKGVFEFLELFVGFFVAVQKHLAARAVEVNRGEDHDVVLEKGLGVSEALVRAGVELA